MHLLEPEYCLRAPHPTAIEVPTVLCIEADFEERGWDEGVHRLLGPKNPTCQNDKSGPEESVLHFFLHIHGASQVDSPLPFVLPQYQHVVRPV